MTDPKPEPELKQRLVALMEHIKSLEDRVSILEDVTIDHESRLQDIEEADEDDSTA